MYTQEDIMTPIIMNCRGSKAVEFRRNIGFNKHDLIMSKKQSVLTNILKVFAIEGILIQHYILGKRIELYFPKHKLAIEIDKKGILIEIKTKKRTKKADLVLNLLELILMKKILMSLLKLVKYTITLINQMKS